MSEQSAAIRKVVQLYFDSYLNADAEGVARVFHEETRLYSVDQGALERTDLPDWLANLRGRREKGDIRKAQTSIVSLDVAADAAAVKASLQFAEFAFTDYLSLLRIGGSWRIVGKIYAVQRPTGNP